MEDIFEEQEEFLSQLENELEINTSEKEIEKNSSKKEDDNLSLKITQIPEIPDVALSDWQELKKEWPSIDYDLFPRWKVTDVPVMIIAGFLGALISNGLYDKFKDLHDNKWGKNTFENGGHAHEIIDGGGGWLHRLKEGHDLFNPKQVDWSNYLGGKESSIIKRIFGWLRHLLQDTFSTEGLPLPGSSYFYDTIKKFIMPGLSNSLNMKQYDAYRTFLTLKFRDTIGAGFVPLAMTAYVYSTEKNNRKKFFNYRYISLTIGALAISIMVGLSMPNPSFNHSAVLAIIPYFISLLKLNKLINEKLEQRENIIIKNQNKLQKNREILNKEYEKIDLNNKKLKSIKEKLAIISKNNQLIIESSIEECKKIISEQDEYLKELETIYQI